MLRFFGTGLLAGAVLVASVAGVLGALPHLALLAVLLVVPLPAAFAVAAGFAAGRLAMPVLSNAWSDDGSWTEVWSAAEPVVRPLLAVVCVGALAGSTFVGWP